MPIVSILNTKGGVGKTTLAISLARAFKKDGKETLLVDSDIQLSAMNWHERSSGDLLDIISLPRTTLDKDAVKFKKNYEWIIIDGVPHFNNMAISAINCSDVVLIPVQPSPFDVIASANIVGLVKDKQMMGFPLKVAFVVNGAIVGTKIGNDVKSELLKYELPIFKNLTGHRVIFPDSAAKGTTVVDLPILNNKAIHEIEGIKKELEVFANNLDEWKSLYQEVDNGSLEIAL